MPGTELRLLGRTNMCFNTGQELFFPQECRNNVLPAKWIHLSIQSQMHSQRALKAKGPIYSMDVMERYISGRSVILGALSLWNSLANPAKLLNSINRMHSKVGSAPVHLRNKSLSPFSAILSSCHPLPIKSSHKSGNQTDHNWLWQFQLSACPGKSQELSDPAVQISSLWQKFGKGRSGFLLW